MDGLHSEAATWDGRKGSFYKIKSEEQRSKHRAQGWLGVWGLAGWTGEFLGEHSTYRDTKVISVSAGSLGRNRAILGLGRYFNTAS